MSILWRRGRFLAWFLAASAVAGAAGAAYEYRRLGWSGPQAEARVAGAVRSAFAALALELDRDTEPLVRQGALIRRGRGRPPGCSSAVRVDPSGEHRGVDHGLLCRRTAPRLGGPALGPSPAPSSAVRVRCWSRPAPPAPGCSASSPCSTQAARKAGASGRSLRSARCRLRAPRPAWAALTWCGRRPWSMFRCAPAIRVPVRVPQAGSVRADRQSPARRCSRAASINGMSPQPASSCAAGRCRPCWASRRFSAPGWPARSSTGDAGRRRSASRWDAPASAR